MKTILVASVLAVFTTSAFATEATVRDYTKTVIEQKPYTVEVCKDVKVPYGNRNNKEFDQEGAIIGGIIGGVIGNQFGKGNGKEAATGIGALTGAIIGGSKDSKEPQGYRTEVQCHKETRYEETTREIYSHSTVTFWHEGKKQILKFQK